VSQSRLSLPRKQLNLSTLVAKNFKSIKHSKLFCRKKRSGQTQGFTLPIHNTSSGQHPNSSSSGVDQGSGIPLLNRTHAQMQPASGLGSSIQDPAMQALLPGRVHNSISAVEPSASSSQGPCIPRSRTQ